MLKLLRTTGTVYKVANGVFPEIVSSPPVNNAWWRRRELTRIVALIHATPLIGERSPVAEGETACSRDGKRVMARMAEPVATARFGDAPGATVRNPCRDLITWFA
jgi:hypothetical protein